MPRLLMIPPPLNFRAATEKNLLDADIGKVHTQRIRDRQDNSDRLPLSMHLTDSCERRSSVSKCTPEWDEKVSFLATFRLMHTLLHYFSLIAIHSNTACAQAVPERAEPTAREKPLRRGPGGRSAEARGLLLCVDLIEGVQAGVNGAFADGRAFGCADATTPDGLVVFLLSVQCRRAPVAIRPRGLRPLSLEAVGVCLRRAQVCVGLAIALGRGFHHARNEMGEEAHDNGEAASDRPADTRVHATAPCASCETRRLLLLAGLRCGGTGGERSAVAGLSRRRPYEFL